MTRISAADDAPAINNAATPSPNSHRASDLDFIRSLQNWRAHVVRLVVTRYRAKLRRRRVEIEEYLVDIAPAPALGRIIALDDRMARGMKMLGRVPVGRVIAAADMAAGPAQSQVQPRRTALQTFLAPARTWPHLANGVGMRAVFSHRSLPLRWVPRGPMHRAGELGIAPLPYI